MVDLGDEVPEQGETFNRIGEALSFDGRRVAFWGLWGDETRTVTLTCPGDGNAARLAACLEQSDPDPVSGEPISMTTREVPVNQGVFVADVETGALELVARTGEEGVEDLLFWSFSGRPPGAGHDGGDDDAADDFEPPRWRASAFLAVDALGNVFKATDYATDSLRFRAGSASALETLFATGAMADLLDPEAPLESWIVALGIERDGLRAGRLTLIASFLNEAGESWAGVYIGNGPGGGPTPVPLPPAAALLAAALAALGVARRRG